MQTERLRLTAIGPPLAGELYRLHLDPGIARWYGDWTRADAEARAAEIGRSWQRDGVGKWLAHHRESGELVGRGGLSYQDVDGARRLEIGWAVREVHRGKGYATEIGLVGLAHARELGVREVVAFTEVHNVRSRAVMERLGFTYRHDFPHRGEPFALYEISLDS
ncbi:GNAT family N-acetyltransferase [Amycolatopsis circi]|uniref:GNAT family N-acetyltransferase n=1 Tax=Amycolatopsis circi TaxID=871959 RepID=UPI001ABFC217|nr:GNAT family N-acetyltransferase [Amycolatopsis circi]